MESISTNALRETGEIMSKNEQNMKRRNQAVTISSMDGFLQSL